MSLISELYSAVMRPLKRPLWQVVYSLTGRRITITSHFHDYGFFSADFRAPMAKVAGLLPDDRLQIVPLEDGESAAITIRLNETRHADILWPYNEVVVAVCVTVSDQGSAIVPGEPGYYYLYLPVTTEDARWPGVENYGFPKFIAQIDVEDTPTSRCCHWHSDGKTVLSLEVPKIETDLERQLVQNYTILDGQLIRCTFSDEGEIGFQDSGEGVRLTLGDHRIADELRALALEPDALCCTYAPRLTAVLSKPMPVMSKA